MNQNCLILVAEDDTPVHSLIVTALDSHGYQYMTAATGSQAVSTASMHNPDIILLDLGLPDMDGNTVIRKVRTWSGMPIIVISARSEDTDKIEALDAGADDYLTKPFSVEELLARIRATQRRLAYAKKSGEDEAVFTNGRLSIDYAAQTVRIDDTEVHLTPMEYRLLTLLAHNVGKVLTYQYITRSVWGSSCESDMVSLRVFMTSLRKKIKDPENPCIQTHIGVGYSMIRLD